MKIKSLDDIKFNTDKQLYNLFVPQLIFLDNISYFPYQVQKTEDMRMDLIMLSMYNDDSSVLKDMDIILFINGIDNPLNVKEGMTLFYVDSNNFDTFRTYIENKSDNSKDVTQKLSAPNKTTRKDDSRKKYIESGYSLPPVVLDKPQQSVRLSGNNILIGGLNS